MSGFEPPEDSLRREGTGSRREQDECLADSHFPRRSSALCGRQQQQLLFDAIEECPADESLNSGLGYQNTQSADNVTTFKLSKCDDKQRHTRDNRRAVKRHYGTERNDVGRKRRYNNNNNNNNNSSNKLHIDIIDDDIIDFRVNDDARRLIAESTRERDDPVTKTDLWCILLGNFLLTLIFSILLNIPIISILLKLKWVVYGGE